jgi:DNA-binding HxlR family transcriptional regulator
MELVCFSDNCNLSECVELTDRESFVCKAICFSENPVSFSQLKKSTQLHQEILSRIVRRLVVHGIIKKVEDGRYEKALT